MMFLLLVEELDYLLLSLERDTKKLKFIKKNSWGCAKQVFYIHNAYWLVSCPSKLRGVK